MIYQELVNKEKVQKAFNNNNFLLVFLNSIYIYINGLTFFNNLV
jgi:hypothetical protein